MTTHMILVFFSLWFGFWNCARGRKLFGLTDSTEIGRMVAMMMMALAVSVISMLLPEAMAVLFVWSFLTLLLWCSPGWDAYWSVTIGQSAPPVKAFAPVDYLMALPPFNKLKGRLWGLVAFTLRMQLILPYYAGCMWYLGHDDRLIYLPLTLTLALPYYILGLLIPVRYVIPAAEIGTGIIIGALSFFLFGH